MTNKFNIEKHILHFWLDHLEIYWTFKDESVFEILDFDNSNYSELDEYIIEKHEVPRFKYKISFKKDSYTLFAYYKWISKSESQWVWTRDYITIYSTAFKLYEYEEIAYFIENYLNLDKCRRYDICMDLNLNITELLNSEFKVQKTGTEFKKSWKIETRYYWELKNTKNKRQLIRVYDKQKDILAKKKVWLYKDYLIHDNVTRIELEIRPELAKNRHYSDIFDDILLIWIFKNYLYKYTHIFEEIPVSKMSLYKAPEVKFDAEDYQWLYYKTQRKAMFLWHAKTIFNMWFCPVRVLILEWLIKEKTLLALWMDKIQDIYKKEKDLAEEHYFKRNFKEFMEELYGRGL